MPRKKSDKVQAEDPKLVGLLKRYRQGVDDIDIRSKRKNGWYQIFDAYMNKLPANWPYRVRVTDPRIRTTLMEKTGRLMNSKLQGTLVPREGGDIISARVNNALLGYQWDNATKGGTMLEKLTWCDQTSRMLGGAFVQAYWDTEKESNEIKKIDPRDIFFDPGATHISTAKWVQVREFTTVDNLEGYNIQGIDFSTTKRENAYQSFVKRNRGLEDKYGDDPVNPVVEVVTEWTNDREVAFLPKYHAVVRDRQNPYKHKRIPVAMLRYYPLGDDIYGESEVEPVLSLQRAINSILCGYLETMNLAVRPPVKILSTETRGETIVYNPGARWILNNLSSGQEVRVGEGAINSFNSTYPALVAAFNTAMGDQSLGISNIKGYQTDKTATEVANIEKQQNSRDQFNQIFLAEFLKDIMMMWLSNNQQYLFDDPSKHVQVIRIIGKSNIDELEKMGMSEADIPEEAIQEISSTIEQSPEAIGENTLAQLLADLKVPRRGVILNPNDEPENFQIKRKLEIQPNGEAELYITPEDMQGVYDYVPDVKSMAIGSNEQMQRGRLKSFELVTSPTVQQGLAAEGTKLKMSEFIATLMEDQGINDAQGYFEKIEQARSATPETGAGDYGIGQPPIVPGVPETAPVPDGGFGLA